MRFTHTLRFRLLLGSSLLMVILFGLYSYFATRFHADQMMEQVLMSANRVSDFIKSSTHYSMLLNRKEDVYQIINTLGSQPGIEGIRIYNKRGEITYSTVASECGTIVDLKAEACYGCHEKERPLEAVPVAERTRVYQGSSGYRLLGLINPIRNEPSCSEAGCHSHPAERTVLGVLDVRMSLREVDAALQREQQTMWVVAVIMVVVVALGSVVFLLVTVHAPVKKLIEGTHQIAQGNLDYEIPVTSEDELGVLARSFNDMTRKLAREQKLNEQWGRTLEERVREKTEELKRIHAQILQIEKMASLGKLAATVAHELNNPLEGILTYAKLLAKQMRKQAPLNSTQQAMVEDLELIVRETERCGGIVNNLLLFSKKQVGELGLVPVRQIVEKAEKIVKHHLQISGVQFRCTIEPEKVELLCDENQVQQALVALFVNAAEAMPDGGTLTVEVSQPSPNDRIVIAVSDTGVGIAPEHVPHIFEPFFTTKKETAGVGLGLSVVYAIVERHGGTISVHSEPGRGTTFRMAFPPPVAVPQNGERNTSAFESVPPSKREEA